MYRDLGDVRKQGATTNALAIRFKDLGQHAQALPLYTEALALARANLRILSSYTGADGVTLSGHANAYLTIYAPGAATRRCTTT